MTTVANISLIYVDGDDLVTMCIPGMQKKKAEKKLRTTELLSKVTFNDGCFFNWGLFRLSMGVNTPVMCSTENKLLHPL